MENNSKHITYLVNHEETFRRIIINRNYKTRKCHIDFFLAGYMHYYAKDLIEFLTKNEPINLVHETFNPYDKFAIAIYDRDWVKLGYVPKIISPLISYKLENEKNNIYGVIKEINLHEINECKIEIRVYMNMIKYNKS